ncbi:MAG: AmmeMemoRadiSam system protein B [Acidobacteriota bacterium]
MIRKAAVAGRFYPRDKEGLLSTLSGCIPCDRRQVEAKAIIAPHAGYVYSGGVAGHTYSSIKLPRSFVILCPNHTGQGAPISIMSQGSWETPLGRVDIDKTLARSIRGACHTVQESPLAHQREHALEVQLPFLQYFLGNAFRFVPIVVGTQRYDALENLGRTLGEAVRRSSQPALLIASSDMNHFESAERTEEKDKLAIQAIRRLDSLALYRVVHEKKISMCGYGPAIAVMEAARLLGATGAQLIEHAHSGQVSGDCSRVVGYAGLVIH